MLFLQALAFDLDYTKYRGRVYYNIPWMNNSQYADVAFDGEAKRVKYAFYNSSNEICDYTVGDASAYKYARTTNKTYQCIYASQQWEDTKVNFVPEVSEANNWTQLENTMIHGKEVEHYRVIDYYVGEEQPAETMNYTDVRTWQQDFYCKRTDAGCIPMKWYMQSKSNFASHYDIYIIEYTDFELTAEDSDFEYYDFNGIAVCSDEPDGPVNPDGPTMNHMVHIFRQPKHRKASPVVQKNIDLLRKWSQNKNFTFQVAPNMFIDTDIKEVIRSRTGRRAPLQRISAKSEFEEYLTEPKVEDLPKSLDWRVKGAMTYVKDQLFCGSCWTFSAIGTLEGRINADRVKRGVTAPVVQLSEQQIVDCFWQPKEEHGFTPSAGCEGGDENDVMWQWANSHANKFATEAEYPYLGQNDWCKNDTLNSFRDYEVTGYHEVPVGDIVQMKRALMNGPVAIGIAVPETMAYYAGGVYNDPACLSDVASIGHAVVAVGWGESEFGPYWIVRNSWSPLWGMDGYIYIAMENNLCGVLTLAAWVDVKKLDNPAV